jgi:methylenetetrahydrofolate reductase (NADPH)
MRVVELSGEKEPSELSITLQVEPDAAARTRAGVEYAIELATKLVDGGAPAIHLYAFNRHDTVLDVVYGAGLRATTKEK